jgi:two-component system NtrC family sensor kinase
MASNTRKPYPWLHSISSRLYLLIIVIIGLTILLVSYLDSRVSVRLIDSEITLSAKRDASDIAAGLARADAPTEPAAIQVWLRKYQDTVSYISSIDVYRSADGSVTRYATTSDSESQYYAVNETTAIRDSRTLTITQYQDRARFLKIIVPFVDSNGVRSCVSLVANFSQSELIGRIQKLIAYFLVPGAVGLSVILLHFLFTRLLIRRFDRLITSMNAAREGDLGTRASVDRNDEIGAIAQRYNEMMQQIESASNERDRLLEEQKTFNLQLREKVYEATHEVADANEKLRQVNEDLLEAQRRLMQAERAAVVGQMAAIFAHEIGSPLSAISTHLELMAEDAAISADTRRRLKLIQDQVGRITGYVEEMLSETRSAAQARSPVQLNRILQQLLFFMEQHLTRRRVQVETHLSPNLPEMKANPQQLQQVFLNLLNNACDAMPNGGTVTIETSGYSDSGGNYVMVSIADTGTGIAKEKQAHIFEPFFTTKELHRGTGLGLSIAAKIVRQHQGVIELESAPDAGAKFTIRFRISGAVGTISETEDGSLADKHKRNEEPVH